MQVHVVTETKFNTMNGRTPGRTPRKPRKDTTELDPVEVYCRIRPVDIDECEKCVKVKDESTVIVAPCNGKNGSTMEYRFTRVYGETVAQKQLFDSVGAPLIEDLIRGKNGLMFTYGITSSGKTYTMTGTGEDQGILPRCLDMVFNSINDVQAIKYVFMPDRQNGFDVQSVADAMLERQRREIMPSNQKNRNKEKVVQDYSNRDRDPSRVFDIDEDSNYAVFVSFVEIYNNSIFDLLEELPYDPITGNKPPQSKNLRNDVHGTMFVQNVTEVEVKSTEEAFDILAKGQKRRKVAHTILNAESSRSHSVFNVRLVQAPLDATGKDILTDKNRATISQLSLVDLAGSERTNRTKNSGERLKEAGQINQSLMVLRQCIDILRENQKQGSSKLVPYRDSKVTQMFKNYFDGEGQVKMIVCVNPKSAEYDETLHVMRFAEATQEVQVQRAQERTKFADPQFVNGRRRLAEAGVHIVPPPVAKKPSSGPPAPVPLNQIYHLPQFPGYQMDPSNDDDIVSLQNFLTELMKKEEEARSESQRKRDAFRQLLMKEDKEKNRLLETQDRLEQTNRELLDFVTERDTVVDNQMREISELRNRLANLEKECRTLRQKTTIYQNQKHNLVHEIQNRDMELQHADDEKERLAARCHRKAAEAEAESQKRKEAEAEKARIEQEAREHMSVGERKLRLLRNIVNNGDIDSLPGDVGSQRTDTSSEASSRSTRTPVSIPSYAAPTSATRSKGLEKRQFTRMRATPRQRAASPPPSLRPTPVRNHRRSRSAGERWLDHRPADVMPLDTVLQPKLGKKKKSVGKLEVKDTNKASRYVLTSQDQAEGCLETKIIKGDVMPSAGGGSSVVFTEVETLRQTSPGDRKRRYIPQSGKDYEGEWTDTEERCNIAVEGHGVYKRVKQIERV